MVDLNRLLECKMAEVVCPCCQHKVTESVGRLRADPAVTCPACHTTSTFDLAKFEARIQEVREKLVGLDSTLPKEIQFG